jgi:trans-aconitate 2-methyltransferase
MAPIQRRSKRRSLHPVNNRFFDQEHGAEPESEPGDGEQGKSDADPGESEPADPYSLDLDTELDVPDFEGDAGGGDAGDEGPRDWNASSYDRLADPQEEWGKEIIEGLELKGDETVLDAGCGTGRATKLLAERLPQGRVIGVDASPSMIEVARDALGDEVELIVSDLLQLELPEPVDAVFSNATFHWIHDHDALYRHLYGLMRPGGRLVAQFGGAGNIATVRAGISQVTQEQPFAEYFRSWGKPWNFPTPEEETASLQRARFTKIDCWSQRKRVKPDRPREYLETTCLGAHLDQLPPELRGDFLARVGSHMPDHEAWMGWEDVQGRPKKPTLEYVRLNVSAIRPVDGSAQQAEPEPPSETAQGPPAGLFERTTE